ncbi:MAG: hypothetical protein RLZZ306_3225 [Bacteroidota bacterium]|jgi:hypothetical protein
MNPQKALEIKEKILFGLEKTYENLIEYKKYKKSDLIVMQDKKIVRLKP